MFKMLQKAYSNECLSRMNVFELYGKFCNGWESVDDDSRAGRPQTGRTLEHIAKVPPALADDRCSTIRMLAKQFHTDKETIRKIVQNLLVILTIVDLLCGVTSVNSPWDSSWTLVRNHNIK